MKASLKRLWDYFPLTWLPPQGASTFSRLNLAKYLSKLGMCKRVKDQKREREKERERTTESPPT